MMKKKSGNVATVTWLAHWRQSRGASSVHSQQIVSAQAVAFPGHGRNEPWPRRRRDALSLPPLADCPVTLPQIVSHFGEGGPAVEYGAEVLHSRYLARDGLSRQGVTRFTVPLAPPKSENKRMGRHRSPIQFNKDLALRLKSARVAAGYQRAEDFAKELGVAYERYKKWESGRTPIQHEYVSRACELTGKDANYLYGLGSREQEQRKTG
jgi:DNA-binding XRE family transcriptional regulator